MSAFFELFQEYFRFWPYLAAGLVGVAIIDRKIIGRYLIGALLIIIAVGGAVGMNLSPFTFSGDGYYMQSLLVILFTLAALTGYAVAVLWQRVLGGDKT